MGCLLEGGTTCVLDCSVVARGKGAGNTSWSVPKTAEGPLLIFLLCKPISCVGPNFSNLLQAITCPLYSTRNPIFVGSFKWAKSDKGWFVSFLKCEKV